MLVVCGLKRLRRLRRLICVGEVVLLGKLLVELVVATWLVGKLVVDLVVDFTSDICSCDTPDMGV